MEARKRSDWLRRPRTVAEERHTRGDELDGIKIRGKRRKLPDNYDDIRIGSIDDKSWKRLRKIKWVKEPAA